MTGRVFIASKKMRGEWAARPDGSIVIDVTSAQAKTAPNRLCLSPMTMKTYTDPHEGSFPNFEAYWQSLKVLSSVSPIEAKQWWKSIEEPKRRHPKMRTSRVLHSKHKRFPDQQLGYVESRKKVYVPDYFNMIKDHPHFLQLRDRVMNGDLSDSDMVVYDFDGPKREEGFLKNIPDIQEVSIDMLKDKINDEKYPFGHGYVVAAALANILPAEYVM